MQRAVHIFQLLALIALTLFLGELAWTIQRLRPKVELTVTNADRAMIAVGAAAGNLEKASREWEKASKDQAEQTTLAMQSISQASKAYGDLAATASRELSTLSATLNQAVREQNEALLKTQADLQSNLSRMAQATAEAQKVLADADRDISDPAIKNSLANVATSSQNLAAATNDAAGTMKSVRSGVEYEVAQIEKPVTKIKVFFLLVVTALGKFFGFA